MKNFLLVLALSGIALPDPGAAQAASETRRVSLHLGAALLTSVPKAFTENRCGLNEVEGTAGVTVSLGGGLRSESSLSIAGAALAHCENAEALAPPLNGSLTRSVVAAAVYRQPRFALSQRATYEFRPTAGVAPRVSLGGGWFLGQASGFWSTAFGFRLGAGGWAPIVEVERTGFRIELTDETRTWVDGVLVDQVESGPYRLSESMWAFRVRFALPR